MYKRQELAFAVATAVRAGDQARRSRHALRRSLGTALASCACFVLLVNTSPTFAQAVYEVPVLGRLARIFTVAEYQIEDQEHLIDVRLPALENTGHTALEQRINTEISTRIQSLLDEAEERARSARAAYICLLYTSSFDGVTPQYVADSCLYFINIHHLSGHRFQVRPLRRANFS